MALIDPPAFLGLSGNEYPAARFRRVSQLLLGGREGVLSADGLVVSQTDTPGLSVQVSAGAAVINGDDVAGQGAYVAENTAAATVGPVSTPHSTLARIDRLILEVLDQEGTGTGGGGRGSDLAQFRIVAGTPSASPTPPAEPDTAITLALITVAAGASALLDASIVDARTIVPVGAQPPWQAADIAADAIDTTQIKDGAVTAAKTSFGGGLQAIPLSGSWVSSGGHTAGAYRDGLTGLVYPRGRVQGGGSATIGTLPVGYRPSATEWFTVAGDAGFGWTSVQVSITTAGVITIVSSAIPNAVSLSGICFRTS